MKQKHKYIDPNYPIEDSQHGLASQLGIEIDRNACERIPQVRFRRATATYPAGPCMVDNMDLEGVSGVSVVSVEDSDLPGHKMDRFRHDDFGPNKGLVGVQFSTHPASPRFISFPWAYEPGCSEIIVYLTMKVGGYAKDIGGGQVAGPNGHVMAFYRSSQGHWFPHEPETRSVTSAGRYAFGTPAWMGGPAIPVGSIAQTFVTTPLMPADYNPETAMEDYPNFAVVKNIASDEYATDGLQHIALRIPLSDDMAVMMQDDYNTGTGLGEVFIAFNSMASEALEIDPNSKDPLDADGDKIGFRLLLESGTSNQATIVTRLAPIDWITHAYATGATSWGKAHLAVSIHHNVTVMNDAHNDDFGMLAHVLLAASPRVSLGGGVFIPAVTLNITPNVIGDEISSGSESSIYHSIETFMRIYPLTTFTIHNVTIQNSIDV